jgi:hypothetical protein
VAECQNCSIVDDELVDVHRVYLVFAPDADGPASAGPGTPPVYSERVEPDVEHWCIPCASQFPCQWL